MKKLLLFFSIMSFSLNAMNNKNGAQTGLVARLQMFDPDALANKFDEGLIGRMSEEDIEAVKACECVCRSGCALAGYPVSYCAGGNPCVGFCGGFVGGTLCGHLSALFLLWRIKENQNKQD